MRVWVGEMPAEVVVLVFPTVATLGGGVYGPGQFLNNVQPLRNLGIKMANSFGTDIIIQAPDPKKAALFYTKHLGFEITDESPNMISLHGEHINFFIEKGPALGPVMEITVASVEKAKRRLVENGSKIVKDEPEVPRCYVKDPYGLIYNLTS